jgi:fermentation-respiration switch protein FrsA (DUF1100 family)
MRSSSERKIAYTLLLVLFLLTTGCTSLFFQPQKELVDNPIAKLFLPEDVFFKTPDGLTLHGWLFKARDSRGSILVLHGNAQNLSTHVNSVLWLVQEGFNVFIFDYRGYGKSEGKPTVQGVHVDAEAALETLLTLPGVDKEKIAVLGQSIGGAVAVYLVANSPYKQRVKALIIDSVFSSYRLIAREKMAGFFITWPFQYPLSFLFSDYYSPVKWINKVYPVPILILHGAKDRIVPVHHGHILYDAALQPKEFVETAAPGHIRAFADEEVRKNVAAYLSRRFEALRIAERGIFIGLFDLDKHHELSFNCF